jgi:hypothetical protein
MKGKYGKQKQNLVWRVFRGSEEIAKTHDLEEADHLREFNDGNDASIRVGPTATNTITVWDDEATIKARGDDPYGSYACNIDEVFEKIANEAQRRALKVYRTDEPRSQAEVKMCNFLLNQF